MPMNQTQDMSMEQQLELIQSQLRDIQATQDVLVNYMQVVAVALGLQERTKELDVRLDLIRAGLADEDTDRMTPIPETKP